MARLWSTLLVGCQFLLVTLFVAPALRADDPTLKEFLDAGEFGPAQQLADRQPPATRDRILGEIANAQFQNGASRGAVKSLSLIGSDLVRSDAVGTMQNGRLGEGRPGGAALADFDTLIELITTTVEPDSWEEVGGAGAIQPFPGGVYVDSKGLLAKKLSTSKSEPLINLRAAAAVATANADVHQTSALRKVSLTRLEKEIQLRAALGQDPSEAMRQLAGVYKVKYVFVYPETGDIVIAGPAGDWQRDGEQRSINRKTGKPVLQLDDLVVLLRNAKTNQGKFGCSIDPRPQNLAATQAFLQESAGKSIDRTRRAAWLKKFQAAVGRQDIKVFGIDPRTRAAKILVEADYRMKLVGMGLEPGVAGVSSYLDSLDSAPKKMNVLRWWFTLNYDSVQKTRDGAAYELHGQGVKVLSENEMLNERGQRVHTGKADALNRQFANSFTKHFNELAIKYPIYADMRNVFDLALVAGLVQSQDLHRQVNWHMTHFGNPEKFAVSLGVAPTEVESIVNHRVLSKRQFIAGVSGGVSVDSQQYVSTKAIKLDEYGLLKGHRLESSPKPKLSAGRWWWD